MVSILLEGTRIKGEVGHITIFKKEMKREEMKTASNIPILAVIIFSRLKGSDESQHLGGRRSSLEAVDCRKRLPLWK